MDMFEQTLQCTAIMLTDEVIKMTKIHVDRFILNDSIRYLILIGQSAVVTFQGL